MRGFPAFIWRGARRPNTLISTYECTFARCKVGSKIEVLNNKKPIFNFLRLYFTDMSRETIHDSLETRRIGATNSAGKPAARLSRGLESAQAHKPEQRKKNR
jgi:hypothetical protein